jgi:hypothetical protein
MQNCEFRNNFFEPPIQYSYETFVAQFTLSAMLNSITERKSE